MKSHPISYSKICRHCKYKFWKNNDKKPCFHCSIHTNSGFEPIFAPISALALVIEEKEVFVDESDTSKVT